MAPGAAIARYVIVCLRAPYIASCLQRANRYFDNIMYWSFELKDSVISKKEVLGLYLSDEESGERLSREAISVEKNGAVGDKFYAKDPQRSILIASIDSYRLAKQEGIDIPYGSLGENILLDYNPYTIPSGTRFTIGEAVFEISQNCTLCKSLTRVDKRLPKLLKNDRGIFARVVKEGVVKIGDKIML